MRVAALYVETGGCYFGLPDVDPWNEARDARTYAGPYPIVAHPPCQRWGDMWMGSPLVIAKTGVRKKLGDDDGCFEHALSSVRKWGGVIEHPEGSRAWRHFGLRKPLREGGWIIADRHGGWTCRVEQSRYGHAVRKATWLYAAHCKLPKLEWGVDPRKLPPMSQPSKARIASGRTPSQNAHGIRDKLRNATPIPFRDLLDRDRAYCKRAQDSRSMTAPLELGGREAGREEALFDGPEFARMIRYQMHVQRVKQSDVCDQTGISRPTLCRILSGKDPSIESYLRIKRWISKGVSA